MTKKIVRLTEGDLNDIIRESVKRVLNEDTDIVGGIDITKIPIDVLKRGYFDYRLIPKGFSYDDILNELNTIKEAIFDVVPPDNAVKNILRKYKIPQELIIKQERAHGIYIYVLVAMVGENCGLIENDMGKMGYFLSKKGRVMTIQGMDYQELQFEPSSQIQEDITDMVKSKYDILYHWTPTYNIKGIFCNGLIPNCKNSITKFPPRIYFMEGNTTDEQRMRLCRFLCAANNNPKNNGRYALLTINIQGLDDSVRFYYDPMSEIAIYTEQPIPNTRIKLSEIVQIRDSSVN